MEVYSETDTALLTLARVLSRKHSRTSINQILARYSLINIPPADKFTKLNAVLTDLHRSGHFGRLASLIERLIESHSLNLSEKARIKKARDTLIPGRNVPIDLGRYGSVVLDPRTRRMIRAHATLRTLENELRRFIARTLADRFGGNWWEDHTSRKVKEHAQRVKQKELQSIIHSVTPESEIFYTDFKDLRAIINKDNNWPVFRSTFSDQVMAYKKLKELELVRNIIAHNRTIKLVELRRLELYAHDFLKSMGVIDD